MSKWKEIQKELDELTSANFVREKKVNNLFDEIYKMFINGEIPKDKLITVFFYINRHIGSESEIIGVSSEKSGSGARRSLGDIYNTIKRYYDVTLEEVHYLLMEEVVEVGTYVTFICPDVKKRVYRPNTYTYIFSNSVDNVDDFLKKIDELKLEAIDSHKKTNTIGNYADLDEFGMYFHIDKHGVPINPRGGKDMDNYDGYECSSILHPDDTAKRSVNICPNCERKVYSPHPDDVRVYEGVSSLQVGTDKDKAELLVYSIENYLIHVKKQCYSCYDPREDGGGDDAQDSIKGLCRFLEEKDPGLFKKGAYRDRVKELNKAYPNLVIAVNGSKRRYKEKPYRPISTHKTAKSAGFFNHKKYVPVEYIIDDGHLESVIDNALKVLNNMDNGNDINQEIEINNDLEEMGDNVFNINELGTRAVEPADLRPRPAQPMDARERRADVDQRAALRRQLLFDEAQERIARRRGNGIV